MTGDSSSILGDKRSAELSVIALDQQIADHQKADGSRSVLGWAVSQIWRSDEGSLTRLQKLSKDVHEAESKGDTARVQQLSQDITTAVQKDQDAVGLQGEISHYAGGGLKTAALFFGGGKGGLLTNRGVIGLAATVGLYGLDEAKMSDDAGTFATNFAFGGAKGGATKALFQGLGGLPIESPAAKGIVLGMGSRLIDTTLTPSNYKDADGHFNLAQGLGKTWGTATDTRAMLIDATLFSAAHGITRGANWLTQGAVDARPMYNTIATSASFGLSGGAYNEMQRQIQSGEGINYGKIATRALLQGGVDMIAGVPGGLNADPQFRQRPWESMKEDGAAIAQRFGFLKETGLHQTAAEMLGQRGTRQQSASGDTTEPLPKEQRFVRNATDGADKTDVKLAASVKPATTVDAENFSETATGSGDAKETKVEIKRSSAASRNYTPDEIQKATEALDTRIGKLSGHEPTPDQMQDLTTYLKDHPEGDQHAATLYVRNFSNPAVRRAIEGFYKPGFAMANESALATPPVREAYEKFDVAIRDDANRTVLPHILGGYVKNMIRRAGTDGPELREVIEHHARTTYDEVAAKAIDFALGTKYAKNMDTSPNVDRTMPLTDKDIEYVRAIALGKPLPGGPTRVAGDTDMVAKLLSGEPHEFAARDLEAAQKQGFIPDEIVREAQRGLTDTINKEAEQMRTGTDAEKLEAAHKLADHLGHESAKDWFQDWIKVAPNTHISAAGELANPLVQRLVEQSPDAVREFLSNDPNGLALSYRFRALSDIANTFEAKPHVAEELLKIGSSSPDAMRQIGFELTRGFARQQYAQWLEKMVTPKDGQAQPTLDQISGDSAMRKARIFTAFGDTPVGKYMEQFADAQPEAAQKLLQKLPRPDAEAEANPRGGPPRPPRGADLQVLIQNVVERRIAAGVAPDAIPEQLSPDLLQMEIRLNNAFKKNPVALDSLLTFARSHLTEVNDLLQMPMTPDGQRIAAARAPKGRPDRNDPQVQAQMNLKKLGFAYTDLMGMVAPKAAELGPEQGLQQLQAIQSAFSDVIIKNFAATMHPDQPQMRTNAELAERELNRLTDPFLPEHEVLRRDAQLRREAIAKQDANLLPNGPPPDLAAIEARAAKTTPTPRVDTSKTVPPVADTTAETTTPPVVADPTPPVVVEETKLPDQPIDTTTKITTPADLGVDLKVGPESTISRLKTRTTARTTTPPPVINEVVAQNLDAIDAEKQQDYQRRKGKSSYGEEDDDGGGRGKGRKGAKGYRSAREWREANRDDWEE